MNNDEKLKAAFVASLDVEPSVVTDDLTYNSIRQWDSVAHMGVVAAVEEAFGVMLDTDDIVDMSSVAKTREILKKYDVAF
jgi:acyl carrier protein